MNNKEIIKTVKTKGRIPLPKRIAMKCLGCAGSPKEVTLCHLMDCPLWTMRFGITIGNKRYAKRIDAAKIQYPDDVEELRKMGINIADFYKDHPISVDPEEN